MKTKLALAASLVLAALLHAPFHAAPDQDQNRPLATPTTSAPPSSLTLDVVAADGREAIPSQEVLADPEPPRARSFDEIFEEICSVMRLLHVSGATGGETHSPRLSELYREIFTTSAPWRGYLARLDALPADWSTPDRHVIARAAELGIDFWLQRTSQDTALDADVARRSVSAFLERLLFHEPYHDLLARQLLAGPHVRPEHEPEILTLLDAAKGDYAFAAPTLARLLAQLWARSPGAEALVVQALGTDRALARAALEAMLLRDGSRDDALRILDSRRDIAMVEEIARAISHTIDVKAGVDVVRHMKSAYPHAGLTVAYAALAGRQASFLAGDYRATLLDPASVSHRKELVAALGNYSSSGRVRHAQFAFENDTNPHIRGVALLALGAEASVRDFDLYLERAMADPELMTLGTSHYIVNAIGNRGQRGDRESLLSSLTNLELAAKTSPRTEKVIGQVRGRLAAVR